MTETANADQSMVTTWWIIMSIIATFNLILLGYVYTRLKKKKQEMGEEIYSFRHLHFIMAAIYTVGCAFRSYFPRGDVERVVLFDNYISAVVIGRSVATIAELAFVVQWALLLKEMARYTNDKRLSYLAMPIVPIIFVAEICSWYGVMTTNTLGNTIEETIWGLSAAIMVAAFIIARPYYQGVQKKFLMAGIVLGGMFVIYMFTVDVPSYYNAYVEAKEAGKEFFTIAEGWRQVTTEYTKTFELKYWKYAFVWMTGYFSMAVWMSIYMIICPRFDQNVVAGK